MQEAKGQVGTRSDCLAIEKALEDSRRTCPCSPHLRKTDRSSCNGNCGMLPILHVFMRLQAGFGKEWLAILEPSCLLADISRQRPITPLNPHLIPQAFVWTLACLLTYKFLFFIQSTCKSSRSRSLEPNSGPRAMDVLCSAELDFFLDAAR